MKKLFLFIICIFSICLSSCGNDTTQLAKDEFSKYYNGNDEVVLKIDDNLYFEKHILMEDDLNMHYVANSYIFYENSIYFLSLVNTQMGYKNESIELYSCDYFGKNINLIFTISLNVYSKIKVIAKGTKYYIKYRRDATVFIDKFDIFTFAYENVYRGKDCKLSDYAQDENPSKYNILMNETVSRKEHGEFIIADLETGDKRVIDDNYLKNTIYIESMEKFKYGIKRFDISKGHILLTYSLVAGDGWNSPHLVFEYDFEENKLEYKLLVFPYDNIPVEIIYMH